MRPISWAELGRYWPRLGLCAGSLRDYSHMGGTPERVWRVHVPADSAAAFAVAAMPLQATRLIWAHMDVPLHTFAAPADHLAIAAISFGLESYALAPDSATLPPESHGLWQSVLHNLRVSGVTRTGIEHRAYVFICHWATWLMQWAKNPLAHPHNATSVRVDMRYAGAHITLCEPPAFIDMARLAGALRDRDAAGLLRS